MSNIGSNYIIIGSKTAAASVEVAGEAPTTATIAVASSS
jgi:hypothetical protein